MYSEQNLVILPVRDHVFASGKEGEWTARKGEDHVPGTLWRIAEHSTFSDCLVFSKLKKGILYCVSSFFVWSTNDVSECEKWFLNYKASDGLCDVGVDNYVARRNDKVRQLWGFPSKWVDDFFPFAKALNVVRTKTFQIIENEFFSVGVE